MHKPQKLLRYALIFGAGLFSGILIAQCLIVLYARQNGNIGGEVFTILALPFLLAAGFSIGFDARSALSYHKGFRDGQREEKRCGK